MLGCGESGKQDHTAKVPRVAFAKEKEQVLNARPVGQRRRDKHRRETDEVRSPTPLPVPSACFDCNARLASSNLPGLLLLFVTGSGLDALLVMAAAAAPRGPVEGVHVYLEGNQAAVCKCACVQSQR